MKSNNPTQMTINRPPSKAVIQRLHKKRPSLVIVGDKGNWSSADLGFLANCTFIKELRVVGQFVDGIEPIGQLRGLRELILHTWAKCPVDFSGLQNLVRARIEWSARFSGLDSCKELQCLWLYCASDDTIKQVGHLRNLEDLEIVNSRAKSFAGLFELQFLRRLRLALVPTFQVSDFRNLRKLRRLVDLEIEACQHATDLASIASCRQLRRLALEDCKNITSLKPLCRLRSLRELYIGGSRVQDNNLKPVLEIKSLRSFAAPRLRSFDPPAKIVEEIIEQRNHVN